MKSQHPEYLESFVKTCMAHGLDEEATAMLLDKARHNDSMANSPEYRDGFHSELLSIKNNGFSVKNVQLGALLKKIPAFWKGVATTVPAMYGAYAGGKYEGARNTEGFSLNKAISEGYLPSLSEFGGAGGEGSKTRFGDALQAMQAADAKLVGGDLRPFTTAGSAAAKTPILPSLRRKLLELENQIQTPVSDAAGYSTVPKLLEQKEALKRQIEKATQLSKTAQPELSRQAAEIEKLYPKLISGQLSPRERAQYEAIASRLPNIQAFARQLGQ